MAPETGDTFGQITPAGKSGTGTGVPTWEVGYLTPKEAFIGLVQTRKANPTWLLQQTKNAPVTGNRNAGGQEWELRDTGKGERSMVLNHRGTTVVLSGSAQLDEFSVLAAAVVKSLDSNPAVTVSPSPAPSRKVGAVATYLTPALAWRRLREGNERFVNGESSHPNQDASRRSSLVENQHPFAVIFGCSDSRLAAEIIFDLGLGDAFVVRTAGQVIDDAVLGSLEYSISVLGVPLIVVLGHDSCGAVSATKSAVETGQMPVGFMRDLVERITPSVLTSLRNGETEVNDMVVEHVKQTSQRLVDSSRVISDSIETGRAAVIGLAYSSRRAGRTSFPESASSKPAGAPGRGPVASVHGFRCGP